MHSARKPLTENTPHVLVKLKERDGPVVNMSRPDRLPRGSRGSVIHTGRCVEVRVSKRFRTVAHLCVLASTFFNFG